MSVKYTTVVKIVFWFIKLFFIFSIFVYQQMQIREIKEVLILSSNPIVKNTIVTSFTKEGKVPLEDTYMLKSMLSYDNKTSNNPTYIPTYMNARKMQLSSLMDAVNRGEELDKKGAQTPKLRANSVRLVKKVQS